MSDGKVVFDIEGNLSGINSALNNATNTISKQTAKWTVLGQTAMNGLVSAAKAGFNAVKDFVKNGLEYNSQMQAYEVNFKTLLGSAEAAQHKIAELKEYAARTPFAMSDLADATQTLLAFNLTSDESALALKYIGDISLGDASKLKSLTLAFSQVSSAGKLAGQDLLQMINAGFNPLNVIAEKTGVAYADLKAVMSGEKTSEDFQLRMEAARREVEELGVNASESAIMLAQIGEDGMISADMVAAAMRIATREGGAFYKALENASATAKGQISTIKDSWDMLAGKVTNGVFDQLSTSVLPKAIEWLDELNAAYDENGFEGLKGAAGGIFDEIGQLALNAGSGLIAQLYNGITGDSKTGEDIKAYLSGLWTDASATLTEFTDAAGNLLGTIYTSISGQEATAENIRATVGGLFTSCGDGIKALIDNCSTLMADIDTAIGDEDLGTGEKIASVFVAAGNAMGRLIDDGATFFTDLYNAITGNTDGKEKLDAYLADLFDYDEYKKRLEEKASEMGMSLEEAQKAGMEVATTYTQDFGYTAPPNDGTYEQAMKQFGLSESQEPDPYAGRFASWGAEAQEAARQYAQYYNEYEQGNQERWEAMEGCLRKIAKDPNASADDFLSAFEQLASQFEEGMVQLPVSWFEGAEASLQSQLDGMNFHTTVNATIIPHLSPLERLTLGLPNGWTGQDHADGGLFNAATRFLGADGMHTFGESGPEVLMPLDALWRKMGFTFDQAFAANLDALQYSVMPQLPAATPASYDQGDLSEAIAAAVKEAVSGLTVEMDKRKVGRILKPVISQEIADDVNNRRWTS